MTNDPGEALAEIEARANAATPGPWDEFRTYYLTAPTQIDGWAQPQARRDEQARIHRDRSFIAHARDDVPALVGMVRALIEAIEKAPHGENCMPWRAHSYPDDPNICVCWKSTALAAVKGGE